MRNQIPSKPKPEILKIFESKHKVLVVAFNCPWADENDVLFGASTCIFLWMRRTQMLPAYLLRRLTSRQEYLHTHGNEDEGNTDTKSNKLVPLSHQPSYTILYPCHCNINEAISCVTPALWPLPPPLSQDNHNQLPVILPLLAVGGGGMNLPTF